MKNITTNIRHPFYESGDAIGQMTDAIDNDSNMSKDAILQKKMAKLKAAHDIVHAHLTENYNWD